MTDTNTQEKPKKDDSDKQHIRGSSLLFAGRLFSVAVNAVMQIIIVRYLVKADYGAFAYTLNFIEILAVLSLVGLDQAASRFVPVFVEQKDYDSLFGFILLSLATILGAATMLSLLLFGTQAIFLNWLIGDELTRTLILLMLALVPMQALDNWFQSLFAGFTNVRAIFFRRYILSPSMKLGAVLFVILSNTGVYVLALGYLLAWGVGILLYISLLLNLLRRDNMLVQFQWNKLKFNFKKIYGFSLPILSSGIVYITRSQMATIFLEFFVSVTAVAEYRAVQPIARLNSVVYQSFVFLYLPLAARLLERDETDRVNNLYWRTTSWIAIASFPAFIVTFALSPQFVLLLFGEQYQDAAILMSIFALGYYINALMGFNLYTVRAYNKLRYLFIVDLIVMVAMIITYFTIIPNFGAIGAALSFTIGIILANTFNHIGMAWYTDVNLFDRQFMPVYLSLFVATVGITLMQWAFNPSIFISVPITGIVWIGLLRLNADRLQVGEIFPELLKVPILRDLINP